MNTKTLNLFKKVRCAFVRNFSCQYFSGHQYAAAAFKWSPYVETLQELIQDAQECQADSAFKLGVTDFVYELRNSDVKLQSRVVKTIQSVL